MGECDVADKLLLFDNEVPITPDFCHKGIWYLKVIPKIYLPKPFRLTLDSGHVTIKTFSFVFAVLYFVRSRVVKELLGHPQVYVGSIHGV